MKSRISFSKLTPMRKSIFRYAPIWALYLIATALIVMTISGFQEGHQVAKSLPDWIKAYGIFNLCYAYVCASGLFGDLYKTKMCYALHALPQRRESWMLSHLSTGMLFSFVPNLLVSCIFMLFLGKWWYLGLCWLLAVTLQFIFYFGIAALSSMLVGNRFAALTVYLVFSFLSVLLLGTVNFLYIPYLEGVVVNATDYTRFAPVVRLFDFDYFQYHKEMITYREDIFSSIDRTKTVYVFDKFSSGWGYLSIIGGAGIAAMGLALLLYRKRHLETAGDFVAFPKLKGVLCVVLTLCVTLCFALIGELFGNVLGFAWVAIGLVVGYFGSLMLLERRVKVFRGKTFLGFGILALVTILSFLSVTFDWFGIESWTPKANQVKSITLANYSDQYYIRDKLSITVEDPEDIQQIIDAHEYILEWLDHSTENVDTERVVLTYKLRSGRTVTRVYNRVSTFNPGCITVYKYLYNAKSILGYSDWDSFVSSVTWMGDYNGVLPHELYPALLEAIRKDVEQGGIRPDNKSSYYVEYTFINDAGEEDYRTLYIDKSKAKNTWTILQSMEAVMGYGDWDTFVSCITELHMMDEEHTLNILQEDWPKLLAAVRKDLEAGYIRPEKYAEGLYVWYRLPEELAGTNIYREFHIPMTAKNTISWLRANGYIPEDVKDE